MCVGATELSLSLSLTGRTTAESSAGSRPWDKGGGERVIPLPKFFGPSGLRFGLKIRGGGASPESATGKLYK